MRFSLKTRRLLAHNLLPLDMLRTGEWADVAEIHGEPSWVGHMEALGLRAGTRLQVLRAGSPCLLKIGPARLSLRGEMAFQVLVRPVAHPD